MPLNSSTDTQKGTLYVVATPVGNLGDITLRALETLKKVTLVAAEDTRLTKRLFNHFGITAKLVSCHEHNEAGRLDGLIQHLMEGEDLALVSDSGTPLISDPGFLLVRKAAQRGITVVPIPGACAAVAALSASGLATDRFLFAGFLPKKKGRRKKDLEELKDQRQTLVFYESPKRVAAFLEEAEAVLGDRQAVVAREVTKAHETFYRGLLSEIQAMLEAIQPVKGECTVLIAGKDTDEKADMETVLTWIQEALNEKDLSLSALSKKIAQQSGLSRKMVYDKALSLQKGQTKNTGRE